MALHVSDDAIRFLFHRLFDQIFEIRGDSPRKRWHDATEVSDSEWGA